MLDSPVLETAPLGFPWWTLDPFLFCVHHDDAYPAGNEHMGPEAPLIGRSLGQDFTIRDGWRMYHGLTVPGFPRHPHRGFETVTLARRGFIDHSDSLGATARFGQGDAQWMTAGRGIEHSEMFPLVNRDRPNPTELFQIWLNLPRASKMVPAHFTMLWADTIPRYALRDEAGRGIEVVAVAGPLDPADAPPTPPNSWAAQPDSEVAIWTIALEPRARWTVPAASPGVNRALYFFKGRSLRLGGQKLPSQVGARVRADVPLEIQNGPEPSELLMLQGRPIGEPVVQHGPFVMNSPREIQRAFLDYRRSGFGRWGWRSADPVHPRDAGRFAVHADGRTEHPAGAKDPSR